MNTNHHRLSILPFLILTLAYSVQLTFCYELSVLPFKLETDDIVRNTILKERIRYLLYHRNLHDWVEMPRSGNVPNATWNSGGKIKVIAHGFSFLPWEQSYWNLKRQMTLQIGEEYGTFENNNFNIIVVDWTPLATTPAEKYSLAAKSVKYAGLDLAEFLIRLKNGSSFQNWDDVHLIGFSLGAHVMGVAGYYVQSLAGGKKVGRITGLDPAGPAFDGLSGEMPQDTSTFLERSDASFVDIIHCNMGTSVTWLQSPVVGRYGSSVQAGHADFYPDGGESQKECGPQLDALGCSHMKCCNYYHKSIREELLACPCENWWDYLMQKCKCDIMSGGAFMGSKCNSSARGRYYMSLRDPMFTFGNKDKFNWHFEPN